MTNGIKNRILLTLMKRNQDPDDLTFDVPEFWGSTKNPEFDMRVRLMMWHYKAEGAMLLHFDGFGRCAVLGEWY